MVKLYQSPERVFYKNEQVDCKDEHEVWMNAEILEIKPDQVKVHYSGYARKFDAWIPNSPDRLVKQWRHGAEFYLNQRIDVLDTTGKWIEARVVDINDTQIRVHYRGFKDRWEEWIEFNSDRIAEIGSKSQAYGVGKIDPTRLSRFNGKEVQEFARVVRQSEEKESRFTELLAESALKIFPIDGDGNCMFRAVSHQLYGDSQYHGLIRARTIEYMGIERDYFSHFIEGGLERFDEYLEYKATNGAWGDDTEIQAMSEIYDRPFHIYTYSATPMRTFHEIEGHLAPIRVSYHGKCHYNSVISTLEHQPLQSTIPGQLEQDFIRDHLARRAAGQDNHHLRSMREAFDQRGQFDLDEAIRLSLDELGSNIEVEEAIQTSLMQQDEDQLITQAIAASRQEWMSPSDADDELQAALAMSREQDELCLAVREAVSLGFSLEAAQNAVAIVGDCPEVVMDFLCSNLG